MENKFIPQAIEIVKEAIHEDNSKNYQEAFRLYKKALEHFMVGVKCTFVSARGRAKVEYSDSISIIEDFNKTLTTLTLTGAL